MTEEKHDPDAVDLPTDQELRALGLEPRQAWVRASSQTNKGARNRRHREKAARQGQRQVSVMVPDHHRETVKKFCKALCSQEVHNADIATVLKQVAGNVPGAGKAAAPGRAGSRRPNLPSAKRQVLALVGIALTSFGAGVWVAGLFV